jgi:hypothetical protein
MNMAKKVIVTKNIPREEVEETERLLRELGATDIKKEENPDKTFNLEGTFA